MCFLLAACGSQERAFEAKYSSPNDVMVTYKGQTYHINRFQQLDNTPFSYAFEQDGDLNLVVEGKEYEIDSPYDFDRKKWAKKTVKKKTKLKKKYKKK